MVEKIQSIIKKRWVVWVITGLGFGFYVYQLWIYSHNQFSILDEGTYLLKGLFFVQGKYKPFEPFGVWTNHMPLSFLIPGYVQYWVGPGIRVGRYFSIVLAVIGILGMWATMDKIGGKQWAGLGVWVMALNPALIKIYSVYTSQVLVFAQLAWVIYLVVDSDKRVWKITLAAFLSGLMILTRINMAPVFLFVILLVVWRDGWKIGLMTMAAGSLPLIGGLLMWPGVLNFWAVRSILNFIQSKFLILVLVGATLSLVVFSQRGKLDKINIQKLAQPGYVVLAISFLISIIYFTYFKNSQISLLVKLKGTSLGIRTHFISLFGGLWANTIWVFQKKFRLIEKTYFSLLWMFNVLLGAHLINSIGFSCEYCFQGYMAFFSFLGLILLVYSITDSDQIFPTWAVFLLGILVVFLFSIEALSLEDSLKEYFLEIQVPRIKSMTILPGTAELWRLLVNKYGYDYFFWKDAVPAGIGMVVGMIFVGVSLILFPYIKKVWISLTYEYWLFVSVFLVALLILPSRLGGGATSNQDCNGDVIAAHEALGKELGELLPAESLVFWYGASPVPLLYTPGIDLYPQPLNGHNNFSFTGADEELLEKGHWNQNLGEKWFREADYLVIERRFRVDWLDSLLENTDIYKQRQVTHLGVECSRPTTLVIYQNMGVH